MGFVSKKWRATIIIIAAICGGGFVLEHFIGFNPVSEAVNVVAAPIKSGFSYIAYSLETARDFIWEMRAYKADNERLEAEIIELKRESRDAGEYKEENERLLKLLELKESITDKETVAAKVISLSQTNRYQQLEISKGSLSGITEGCAVITSEGVVGRVTKVGANYSIVTTILDPSSVMGIKIARTDGTGLCEGDEELAGNSQCKLSFVDRNTPVIVGDVVTSSGSGGIYPSGLNIGTVVSVSADRTGALSFALVDPAVDFDLLREVLVIL